MIQATESYIYLPSEEQEPITTLSNDDWLDFFQPINDNSSHQCAGFASGDAMCLPCPDGKPLWWLVLRWVKMMVLKMATSYHAKPVILVFAPLMLGIAIGYFHREWGHLYTTWGPKRKMKMPLNLNGIFLQCLDFGFSVFCRIFQSPTQAISESKDYSKPQQASLATSQQQRTSSSLQDRAQSNLQVRVEEEEHVRNNLRSENGTERESQVELSKVPQHVAVIMDGNRRYGRSKYGSVSKGHWDGSSKLVEFAKWCIVEHISVLTVYAFSTENWNRDPSEVAALMDIFSKYCDELRVEALQRNIKILVLSTDTSRVPSHVKAGLERMVRETESCTGLTMNICLSYGSRGEIVNATKVLVEDVLNQKLHPDQINEREFEDRLLTSHCGNPDVLIRTSGEIRISNFLLWQLAYSEMFFVNKPWPAMEKEDLLRVIESFASGRTRRYGK